MISMHVTAWYEIFEMERVRNVELLSRLVARDTYRNDSESATVKFDVIQKTVR